MINTESEGTTMKHLGVATTVQELMNLLSPYHDYLIYVEQPCGDYKAWVSIDEENKIIEII